MTSVSKISKWCSTFQVSSKDRFSFTTLKPHEKIYWLPVGNSDYFKFVYADNLYISLNLLIVSFSTHCFHELKGIAKLKARIE